jgi:hypothetical protein
MHHDINASISQLLPYTLWAVSAIGDGLSAMGEAGRGREMQNDD